MPIQIKSAVVLALTFAAVLAQAGPPDPNTTALGRELVRLSGYKDAALPLMKECSSQFAASADPKEIYKSNPGVFSGISPQSAYWPNVEALYRTYATRVCSAMSVDDIESAYATDLASRLTREELEATVTFLSSRVGKRYSEVYMATSMQVQKELWERISREAAEANSELQSQFAKLVGIYRRSPK